MDGISLNTADILLRLGINPKNANITAFKNAEDGAEYGVWKVLTDNNSFVLKKAKGFELEVYSLFLSDMDYGVPHFYDSVCINNSEYFTIEYIKGADLCKCNRENLKKALDSLIYLQDRFWGNVVLRDVGYSYEKSLQSRIDRGKYLNDNELQSEYAHFLSMYSKVPCTLCHDDLLPFNVLVSNKGAVIIDWEFAGMLPYLVSLARLIAHGTNDISNLFYMTDADKSFAADYYYNNLAKRKGIDRQEYDKTLNYFLLYEYCEWVMVGNKYEQTNSERYKRYYSKAIDHARRLKSMYC